VSEYVSRARGSSSMRRDIDSEYDGSGVLSMVGGVRYAFMRACHLERVANVISQRNRGLPVPLSTGPDKCHNLNAVGDRAHWCLWRD
jgi:hypothetical protein